MPCGIMSMQGAWGRTRSPRVTPSPQIMNLFVYGHQLNFPSLPFGANYLRRNFNLQHLQSNLCTSGRDTKFSAQVIIVCILIFMFSDARVSNILIRDYSPECRPNMPFNFFVIAMLICYCRPKTCALYGLSDDLLTTFVLCCIVLYCASSDVRWHGQTY
jgi:hypothetical protein